MILMIYKISDSYEIISGSMEIHRFSSKTGSYYDDVQFFSYVFYDKA